PSPAHTPIVFVVTAPPPPEIYTLSLHDALPIFVRPDKAQLPGEDAYKFRHLLIRDAAYEALPKATRAELHERFAAWLDEHGLGLDRKSTRLNSSHSQISYAVFCLKKKKKNNHRT